MKLRKAKKEDHQILAIMLLSAMEDLIYEFLGVKNKTKALEFLEFLTEKENNQYSYQNCYVLEVENDIVAAINIYDGAKIRKLREPVAEYIFNHYDKKFSPEDESSEGEYYIDSLAVKAEEQGKGYGTQLLKFVINEFSVKNNKTIGLIVDKDNPKAKKLYKNLGFRVKGDKTILGKEYEHLVYNNEKQENLI